jgi:hypothetical protein
MNGDGGHGGFNPGRGGFNHGRGGFQSRGGFANGRPAMLYADVWGKVAAEEGKVSTVAADTKVMVMVLLAAIIFKGNQVGQPEVGIIQIPEMRIGGGAEEFQQQFL